MVTAGSDYFAALQIPIHEGRAFRATDPSNTARVAIVDETMARQIFPTESLIGKLLLIDSMRWQIMGVAADTRRGAHGTIASAALRTIGSSKARRVCTN
jgi:putative ABC transport system permease protein